MNKILIIDDEVNNHLLLGEILEDYPIPLEIITAEFGDQGMELIEKEKPEVVFVDRMLPMIDGLEICRRVKANPELNQKVSVIIISAMKNTGEINKSLADAYIQKPYKVNDVYRILDRIFNP